jgi:hypothetical protein
LPQTYPAAARASRPQFFTTAYFHTYFHTFSHHLIAAATRV